MSLSYEQLARKAFAGPVKAVGDHELRFGRKGGVSVCLKSGVWYDFEQGKGGRLEGARPLSDDERQALEEAKAERRRDGEERAQRLWSRCLPARSTLVETYLRHRGLVLPETDEVRFHPRCWHDPREEHWPAMVSAVRDRATGRLIGAHRTYLSRDGRRKAPMAPDHQRRLLGSQYDGAAFVLGYEPAVEHVNAGESVEEAIAVWMLTGSYTIGLLNAGILGGFRPYGAMTRATLFLNHDHGGLAAGQKAASRYRCLNLLSPGWLGADWNDLVRYMRVVSADFAGPMQPGAFPYREISVDGPGYRPRIGRRRAA